MLLQWLAIASLVVGIPASVVVILGWKGVIPTAADLWRRFVKKPVRHESCYIDWRKDALTLTAFFFATTTDGQTLHYKEPFHPILNVLAIPPQPSANVAEHVAAVERLKDRLRVDGWEYVGVPPGMQWYQYAFRRPLRRARHAR